MGCRRMKEEFKPVIENAWGVHQDLLAISDKIRYYSKGIVLTWYIEGDNVVLKYRMKKGFEVNEGNALELMYKLIEGKYKYEKDETIKEGVEIQEVEVVKVVNQYTRLNAVYVDGKTEYYLPMCKYGCVDCIHDTAKREITGQRGSCDTCDNMSEYDDENK